MESETNPTLALKPGLADACAEDIRRFVRETADLHDGVMPLADYKARRAKHGSYEQRQDGFFMVRPRMTAGILRPAEARAAASIGNDFGNGILHLTTRQDLQLHGVLERDVPEVMRRLLAAGMPCRGTGGDSPRNVAVCPLAGVCPHEAFDVTPHALALGEHLLVHADAFKLPRKFKPGFSGCACDCAGACVSDCGFIAYVRDGRPGFVLYSGGGLGTTSRLADRLEEWIPEADSLTAVRALLKIFERHGDRANRAKARLRYVFERQGADAVRAEFRRECAASPVSSSVPSSPPTAPPAPPAAPPWRVTEADAASGLRIIRQRQPGLVSIAIRPPLGLIFARDLERIADAAERFSQEKELRLTPDQGLLLRSVPEARLPELGAFLGRIATGPEAVAPEGLITVCSGASTCRLGQLDSRAFARVLAAALRDAAVPPELLEEADIRINGCTNSCGHAPVAGIGLCGVAQTVAGNEFSVPHYRILLGARHGDGRASLNEQVALLPEADVPGAVIALLRAWQTERASDEPIAEFAHRLGPERLRRILGAAPMA
jgi:sulfite reductase beta subunit-like hemoprotein